jgi:hypothetical protein
VRERVWEKGFRRKGLGKRKNQEGEFRRKELEKGFIRERVY